MESDIAYNLLTVAAYTCMWLTLYFVLCLRDPKKSYEWHCRIVTVIHASLISFLAFYGVFALGPWPWTDSGGPNTPHQVQTCSLCLGYFLFDFTWCLYHKTEGPVMLSHHTLSIVGMTSCLLAGKYGTELMATIAGAEVTNPLLQLRWFMKEMDRYHSVWGDLVDAAFMLSFGFVRIFLGSWLLYCYFQQSTTDFMGRLGGVLIYAIGWAFFINTVQFAVYKYSKRYNAWKQRQPQQQQRHSAAFLPPHQTSASIHDNGIGKPAMTQNDILRDEDQILTQREIKLSDGELTVRRNHVLTES